MRNALINEILEGLNSVPESRRNSQLYVAARKLARFGWSQNRARKVLLEAAQQCSPPIHPAMVYLVIERVYRQEEIDAQVRAKEERLSTVGGVGWLKLYRRIREIWGKIL